MKQNMHLQMDSMSTHDRYTRPSSYTFLITSEGLKYGNMFNFKRADSDVTNH
jgi:hypothetical protein